MLAVQCVSNELEKLSGCTSWAAAAQRKKEAARSVTRETMDDLFLSHSLGSISQRATRSACLDPLAAFGHIWQEYPCIVWSAAWALRANKRCSNYCSGVRKDRPVARGLLIVCGIGRAACVGGQGEELICTRIDCSLPNLRLLISGFTRLCLSEVEWN